MQRSAHINHIEKCNCGEPIVKRLNSRIFEFRKKQGGNVINIITEYLGDSCKVTCSTCGKTISFLTNQVELGLCYEVAKPPEK